MSRCHLSREEGITLGRALKARAKKGSKMVVSASRFALFFYICKVM